MKTLYNIKEFLRCYSYNVLIVIDQAINTILFFGDPKETISSRVGRLWPDSWMAVVLNTMVFWQKNHVQNHIEPYVGKDDLISPDRTKPL